MKITWLGHSSFLIESSSKMKIITDPFSEKIGYNPFKENVDIVTISHNHFDHNYTKEISGHPKIVDTVLSTQINDLTITGFPSFHDKVKGSKRGKNIIYLFNIDGFKLCHMGDLGHSLSEDFIDKLGKIDVLFIPVGGNFTIDGKEASEICKKIRSHIIIPMHFKTQKLSFPLDGAEEFIISMKNGTRVHDCTFEFINPFNEFNKIIILDVKQ